MAKQRSVFLEGAEQNGIDKDLAGNIFDLVENLLVMVSISLTRLPMV